MRNDCLELTGSLELNDASTGTTVKRKNTPQTLVAQTWR